MRQIIDPQLQFGEQDISAIWLGPKSRDDIPQLLRGLQHIDTTPEARARVFAILAEVIPEGTHGQADTNTGRPGMEQWKILVLGVLRLGLNTDYDRIHELANQHTTIRQMLGHTGWADDARSCYQLQTIKDNLRLFTPEILARINQDVIAVGQQLVNKSPDAPLHVRADSFVVEADVHFPNDIKLLWDAIRKLIEIIAGLCDEFGVAGWRQSAYQLRQFKKRYRQIQRLKHSTSKDADKRAAKQADIRQAHRDYLQQAEVLLTRVRASRWQLQVGMVPAVLFADLDRYLSHAERQLDQIRRRVLCGKSIPHTEKAFSLFEPHTEWINKGKAGVLVELGLRVAVVEDQHRFILTHQVMEKTTDDQVAVALIDDAKTRFPAMTSASFDKGFHSPANQSALAAIIAQVVLPRKGNLSLVQRAREHEPEFIRRRRQHSAVESAINALEAHGLDRCPDHGLDGFTRDVALAAVARNIQRLGAILQQQEADRQRGPYRLAA
ncbi:MAG TPA: ISNCY family transposase [Lamprocystis sp. (in: g-proteobacteria)]|nr:ISNCY family transposase [Lamprocystis sp. (in: g-proteobacteria)]